MKTQSGIRRAVAAAFLAGSFVFGAAWAGPMDTAQSLVLSGSDDSVSGSITTTVAAGSPVVVSFWANPTDVVTVDVDTNGSGLDTIASFHETKDYVEDGVPSPYKVILVQDDSFVFPFDDGSTSVLDPLLENMVPKMSGAHYAVVTVAPERVGDGGGFVGGGSGSGTVTLNVTCVRGSTDPSAPPACTQGSTTTSGGTDTPPPPPPADTTPPDDTTTPPATDVKYVNIDVRPGSRMLVPLNPRWKAVIPVAILSGQGFNVRDVDTTKLTFGHTGDENSLRNCNRYFTRLRHSRGHYALVCYFENSQAGFEVGDEVGILKGTLKNGTPIEGRGILKTVPEKRHYGHDHGRGHDYDRRADNDDHRRGRR
jgi:hypothetical protein